MPSIVEDVQTASAWIAAALSSSGYAADFTPQSLWQVDFFFDDQVRAGSPISGGLLSNDVGSRLFAVGVYVGEVIRRERGGEWIGNDEDPQAEINVMLRLPDGTECWPVQRIMKRFTNGSEEGIAVYGAQFGLAIGTKPERVAEARSKPWWRLW